MGVGDISEGTGSGDGVSVTGTNGVAVEKAAAVWVAVAFAFVVGGSGTQAVARKIAIAKLRNFLYLLILSNSTQKKPSYMRGVTRALVPNHLLYFTRWFGTRF